MIATVAPEGRKGEMDACSNVIASRQVMDACSNLIAVALVSKFQNEGKISRIKRSEIRVKLSLL